MDDDDVVDDDDVEDVHNRARVYHPLNKAVEKEIDDQEEVPVQCQAMATIRQWRLNLNKQDMERP